jgi:hypothetical protein
VNGGGRAFSHSIGIVYACQCDTPVTREPVSLPLFATFGTMTLWSRAKLVLWGWSYRPGMENDDDY